MSFCCHHCRAPQPLRIVSGELTCGIEVAGIWIVLIPLVGQTVKTRCPACRKRNVWHVHKVLAEPAHECYNQAVPV